MLKDILASGNIKMFHHTEGLMPQNKDQEHKQQHCFDSREKKKKPDSPPPMPLHTHIVGSKSQLTGTQCKSFPEVIIVTDTLLVKSIKK